MWTIGHWTCPIPDFLAPLDEHRIELLADVRAHPGSRRNPQFGSDAMSEWLPENGIDYVWLPELGGRRRRQDAPDVDPEINGGWQNASFKNYADYTLTDAYRSAIDDLTTTARTRRVAIMCGEPMPWRCHRLLISNTLTAQGWKVEHLVTGGDARLHVLGQWGATPTVGEHGELTYPAGPPDA
ncbi:DNA repair protein [Knoellia sp. Soil729]|nr:DNA repair protein [Knoellia sp. Soil729]